MDIHDPPDKTVRRSNNLYELPRSLFQLLPVSSIVTLCILCAIWLWCRGAGVTSIRIVAEGNHFQAFIDDRLIADCTEESSSEVGGIGFQQGGQVYWGIPLSQHLVAVKVVDNDSGELLIEQDFAKPLKPIWVERTASCASNRPWYWCDKRNFDTLGTGYQEWSNYTMEVKVQNFLELTISLRYQDNRNFITFGARPFREIDSGFRFITEGNSTYGWGARPYYKTQEIVMNIAALFLFLFPQFIFALIIVILIFGLNRAVVSLLKRNYYWYEVLFLIILFLGSFAYLAWVNYYILDHIPHVQDSVAYNFQAQLLSRGEIFAPPPPVPEAFSFDFLIIKNNKWFGQYPFGHPFLLMFGHLINKPWIIPPLIGALVLIIVYLIAKELFSRTVAAVSALLCFFSPFFQMNAPNFMSHSSGSFYLALAMLFLIRACNKQKYPRQGLYAFFSGLSFGFLFNTRPLNAIPAILLSGAVLICFFFSRKVSFKALFCFCVGGLLMLAVFFLINYALMGDPFVFTVGKAVKFFDNEHTLGAALLNYYTLMSLFLMNIFGWRPFCTIIFFFSFLVFGKKNVWTLFLFLLFWAMTLVNLFNSLVNTNAHMYGPRYVYEVFFVFILMVAHGWDQTIQFIQSGLNYIYGYSQRSRIIAFITYAVFLSILVFLVCDAQGKWLSKDKGLFKYSHTPGNIYSLRGFNYVSGDMVKKIEDGNIHNALVFVEDHQFAWWSYGCLFSLNSPFLDTDVIVARDIGQDTNNKVIKAFPNRVLYRVNINKKELRKY